MMCTFVPKALGTIVPLEDELLITLRSLSRTEGSKAQPVSDTGPTGLEKRQVGSQT